MKQTMTIDLDIYWSMDWEWKRNTLLPLARRPATSSNPLIELCFGNWVPRDLQQESMQGMQTLLGLSHFLFSSRFISATVQRLKLNCSWFWIRKPLEYLAAERGSPTSD